MTSSAPANLAGVAASLVILASGNGSTLQALLDADLPATIAAVGTDVPGSPAMARAAARAIPTFAVPPADYADRAAWNVTLGNAIGDFKPDLVVLAGFMRILGPVVVNRFRIVNTHPALLPAFPGAHAIRDALVAGVPGTGVTIHWVDEGVDTGPIIAQAPVPIEAGDDEDSLRARIQAVERPLFVDTVAQLCKELS
jgi:formyltetrahydrofolate-dependent phosphoribosylglycinamide formyltransferase